MAKVTEPITACIKCGGPVWDNRGDKKTAKSPDFKCKDKACDEPYWLGGPARGAAQPARAAKPATTWKDLAARYKKAREIAEWAFPDTDGQVLVQATATVFIQSCRENVTDA